MILIDDLFQTANFDEKNSIQTTLNRHVENHTNSVYTHILPLNGRQMKLQCQMIDLETGQEAIVADIATLMTEDARVSCNSKLPAYIAVYYSLIKHCTMNLQNIFNQVGLRSVEDEKIVGNNVKYGIRPTALQDRKIIGNKSKW